MRKSTIVTILLIILIGIMIVDLNINGSGVFELFFRRLETNSMFESRLNYSTNADYEYSVEKKLVITREDKEKLNIDNNFGSIDIIGEKRENIELKAKITVYSMEENVVKDYAEKFEIATKKEDDSINIISSDKNIPENIKGVKIDYIIKAPESIIPVLSNRFGKLEIRNFINGVDLSNKYEETIVENISGEKIDINAKYGNLTINNISKGNEMIVTTAYNESIIKDVSRTIKIDGSYGKTVLDNIGGKLDANVDYGQIRVDSVKSDIDINGRYTEIDLYLDQDLSDFEFEAKTKYGDIDTSFLVDYRKDDNTKIAKYKEGNGDVKIILDTEYADINIR